MGLHYELSVVTTTKRKFNRTTRPTNQRTTAMGAAGTPEMSFQKNHGVGGVCLLYGKPFLGPF